MSFADELGLLKTWKRVSLTFSSSSLNFVQQGLTPHDSEGDSISFAVGGEGRFMIDFSRVQSADMITKNKYLEEFSSKKATQESIPEVFGACLRVQLAEEFVVFLLEQ